MKNASKNALKSLFFDERGQTSTEYILLIAIVIITAVGAFNLFNKGIVGYYQRITALVSLPIP